MKQAPWLRNANLALAFLLELAALLAYAAAGALMPEGWLQPVAGVIGAGVFILLWGIWAAPRAKRRLRGVQLIWFKAAVFAVAVLVVALAGQPVWAGVFAALVALHLVLALRLRQA